MQISRRCRWSSSNANLAEHDHALGDVAVAGVALVDPVADGAALQRAADDVVEVDLAGEGVVDEQPEAVGGAHLALAVAGCAARAERVAVSRRVGEVVGPQRFPRGQPVLVAHVAPRVHCGEVGGHQRPQHDPLAVQAHARLDRDRRMQPHAASTECHDCDPPRRSTSRWRWRITATTMQHAADDGARPRQQASPGCSARSAADSVARCGRRPRRRARPSRNGSGRIAAELDGGDDVGIRSPTMPTSSASTAAGRARSMSSRWSTTAPIALVSSSGRGGSDGELVTLSGHGTERASHDVGRRDRSTVASSPSRIVTAFTIDRAVLPADCSASCSATQAPTGSSPPARNQA